MENQGDRINSQENTNDRKRYMPAADKILLLEIIKKPKFCKILSNKKTNCASNQIKIDSWNAIQLEYNSRATVFRTVEQIKNIYRNELTNIRKVLADDNRICRKTGGGPYVPPNSDLNPLLAFVQDSMTPLDNIDSTDDIYQDYTDVEFIDTESCSSSSASSPLQSTPVNVTINSTNRNNRSDLLNTTVATTAIPVAASSNHRQREPLSDTSNRMPIAESTKSVNVITDSVNQNNRRELPNSTVVTPATAVATPSKAHQREPQSNRANRASAAEQAKLKLFDTLAKVAQNRYTEERRLINKKVELLNEKVLYYKAKTEKLKEGE